MKILSRINRLFKSDMHQLLDQLENPDAILKQSLREMEEILSSNQQKSELMRKRQETLLARQNTLEKMLIEQQEQVQLCFREKNDSLARAAVRRKLEAERVRKELQTAEGELRGELAELEKEINIQTLKLEEIRTKLALRRDCAPIDQNTQTLSQNGQNSTLGDDEVEIEFLKAKRTWTEQIKGEVA